jgi:hypothetical protein
MDIHESKTAGSYRFDGSIGAFHLPGFKGTFLHSPATIV